MLKRRIEEQTRKNLVREREEDHAIDESAGKYEERDDENEEGRGEEEEKCRRSIGADDIAAGDCGFSRRRDGGGRGVRNSPIH